MLHSFLEIGDVWRNTRFRSLFENPESHLNSGNRRAKLVGYIAQKPFLTA